MNLALSFLIKWDALKEHRAVIADLAPHVLLGVGDVGAVLGDRKSGSGDNPLSILARQQQHARHVVVLSASTARIGKSAWHF